MKEDMTREELVYMAKVCEQTERYDQMLDYMKRILKMGSRLTVDDRNSLSVAYKNSVGSRRTAWRVLQNLEQKELNKNTTAENVKLIKDYKLKVEKELDDICREIIDEISDRLLPNIKNEEKEEETQERVFYLKMQGDYFRYIAEYSEGEKKEEAGNNALNVYKEAVKLAEAEDGGLKTTHPIRLGLALNFSVFYYEVKNDPNQACELAKKAFDDAIADIEDIQEDYYRDSTTIMQLIRDNLTLWNNELHDEDVDEE
jgi:14-3-3 protein epsilon